MRFAERSKNSFVNGNGRSLKNLENSCKMRFSSVLPLSMRKSRVLRSVLHVWFSLMRPIPRMQNMFRPQQTGLSLLLCQPLAFGRPPAMGDFASSFCALARRSRRDSSKLPSSRKTTRQKPVDSIAVFVQRAYRIIQFVHRVSRTDYACGAAASCLICVLQSTASDFAVKSKNLLRDARVSRLY